MLGFASGEWGAGGDGQREGGGEGGLARFRGTGEDGELGFGEEFVDDPLLFEVEDDFADGFEDGSEVAFSLFSFVFDVLSFEGILVVLRGLHIPLGESRGECQPEGDRTGGTDGERFGTENCRGHNGPSGGNL